MRTGLRMPRRPHQLAGYALMALGGLLLVLSLPAYVWTAALGGAVLYLGYAVRRPR